MQLEMYIVGIRGNVNVVIGWLVSKVVFNSDGVARPPKSIHQFVNVSTAINNGSTLGMS
jgi:hypothetical protein